MNVTDAEWMFCVLRLRADRENYFCLIFPLLGGRILPSQRYLIFQIDETRTVPGCACLCGPEFKTVIIKVIRTNAGTFVTTIYYAL